MKAALARGLVSLLVQLLVAIALAVLLALVLSQLADGSFLAGLRTASFIVGALTIMLGVAGGSRAQREGTIGWQEKLALGATKRYWGTADTKVNVSTGALLVLTGLCLVALGIVLS